MSSERQWKKQKGPAARENLLANDNKKEERCKWRILAARNQVYQANNKKHKCWVLAKQERESSSWQLQQRLQQVPARKILWQMTRNWEESVAETILYNFYYKKATAYEDAVSRGQAGQRPDIRMVHDIVRQTKESSDVQSQGQIN